MPMSNAPSTIPATPACLSAVHLFDDSRHRDLHDAERPAEHHRQEQQCAERLVAESELRTGDDRREHRFVCALADETLR